MTGSEEDTKNMQSHGWSFQLHNVPSGVGPTVLCSAIASSELGGSRSDDDNNNNNNNNNNSHPQPSTAASWTYAAPSIVEWSLTSDSLLSITYRSVDQGLPEYTNISATSDYLHRGLTCSSGGRDEHDDTGACFGAGGRSCGAYSRCLQKIGLGPRPVQIHREVYTSRDIVRTEILEDGVEIRGLSSCKCLRVYLKPKIKTTERFGGAPSGLVSGSSTIDTATSAASTWAGHVAQQGDDHREYLGGEPTPDDFISYDVEPVDNLTGNEPWMKKISKEGKEQSLSTNGPILTFAIPMHESSFTNVMKDCPPLLWKVWIPPDPTICVETLTVFEGLLEVGAREPTAVYISGYQSWSYAGTVMRGHTQPSSAMPHILSRAFNRGATVPPRPQSCKGSHSMMKGGDRRACNEREEWDDNNLEDDHDPRTTGGSYSNSSGIYTQSDGDVDDDVERHFYRSDLYACVTSHPSSSESFQSSTASAGPALVLGSLSQRKQLSLVTMCPDLRDVSIQCSLDGTVPSRSQGITSDWVYAQIMPEHCYDEEPTVYYLHAVAAHNNARPLRHGVLLTGWCSWYHYYENIQENMLRQTFDTLGSIRNKIASNVALIDDGYMTAWGDWGSLKPKAFPNAFRLCPNPTEEEVDSCMQSLSNSIRSNGMKPGIWLAPFAADKHSKLAKEKPGWIIRDNNGRFANSSNCGKYFYGLDATNPGVREHVFNTLRRATEVWGFECLKLDFLYAAALKGNGKYDLSLSRAEAMDLALRCLRAGAGSATFIIGCGCPLGTAVGYIDGMRISADTGPTWYPTFPLPSWDNSTLPSLRAMVRNSITRSNLGHRWWHNDPDCILLGETTELTDEEVVSAATVVGMTGGMMLMSDDLIKLRHNRLRIITRVFPLTGASAVAVDLHRPSQMGIPCLLRLWCTDESTDADESVGDTVTIGDKHQNAKAEDQNALAIHTAQSAAFNPDLSSSPNPFLRMRNRVCVARGLGKWSVVSLSNWSNIPVTVSESLSTFLPPSLQTRSEPVVKEPNSSAETSSTSKLGFHVLAFWSSKYSWIPHHGGKQQTLGKRLYPHETEVFHVRPVLNEPQYIGSDIHFTCGYEIEFFKASDHVIELGLKNYCRRSGYVFVYVPKCEGSLKATVNGKRGHFEVIASPAHGGDSFGKVLRIWVTVRGDGSDGDGVISLVY